MYSSLIGVLSQDLIDRLIDTVGEIGDGDGSQQCYLKTCASVCQAFLPRSQYHLFSSVKLNEDRVQEFYEIIQRKALIATRVRALHLVFYSGKYDLDWMVNDHKFRYIMASITHPTSPLYKLKLEGQHSPRSSMKNSQLFLDRVFKPFLARFITSLHIDTLAEVPIALVDSCVQLTELTLLSTSLKYGKPQTDPPQHKLRKLKYDNPVQVKQMTTGELGLRLDFSEIQSLYVHTDSLINLNFEQWIINESSGALEELYFKILDEPESQLQCFVDLKGCPNLQILDLDINLEYPMVDENEDNLDTISRVLSTLPKANLLDTLRLTAYVGYLWNVNDPSDILDADWASFQSQLSINSSGKPFFEFAFRMIYMNVADGEEDIGYRCEATVDKVLRGKLDHLAENPHINIVNCGHFVDGPRVLIRKAVANMQASLAQFRCQKRATSEVPTFRFPNFSIDQDPIASVRLCQQSILPFQSLPPSA